MNTINLILFYMYTQNKGNETVRKLTNHDDLSLDAVISLASGSFAVATVAVPSATVVGEDKDAAATAFSSARSSCFCSKSYLIKILTLVSANKT